MPRIFFAALVLAASLAPVAAGQIRVNPNGVNVNAQGSTTVFLTYGGLAGYQPVEAIWCGELTPAAPALGLRCAPGTIFGQLPIRYDRSTASGSNAFTDVMSIPASVSRRAYQAAEAGAGSAFYYVRRFRSETGGADQYVAVTCRLTGGGARAPLSLTDVRLTFGSDANIIQVGPGEPLPAFQAEVSYTGTGRLTGRWEVVLPGEDIPTGEDLLTEATLPLEQRGTQRRYTQLERFNLFLPPTGRVTVPGPDPARLPSTVEGMYFVLLRVEASREKEGDSNLGAIGAGSGVVAGGAVAGFPMPVLRYLVGSGQGLVATGAPAGVVRQLTPAADGTLTEATPTFSWDPVEQAAEYRLEIESAGGVGILTALLPNAVAGYRAPPWLRERAPEGRLRWRVVAVDPRGAVIARSGWRAAAWPAPAP